MPNGSLGLTHQRQIDFNASKKIQPATDESRLQSATSAINNPENQTLLTTTSL